MHFPPPLPFVGYIINSLGKPAYPLQPSPILVRYVHTSCTTPTDEQPAPFETELGGRNKKQPVMPFPCQHGPCVPYLAPWYIQQSATDIVEDQDHNYSIKAAAGTEVSNETIAQNIHSSPGPGSPIPHSNKPPPPPTSIPPVRRWGNQRFLGWAGWVCWRAGCLTVPVPDHGEARYASDGMGRGRPPSAY